MFTREPIFLLTIIILFSSNSGFCQEVDGARVSGNAISNSAKPEDSQDDSAETKLIGSIFRTLAKSFIAAADIDQLKRNSINRINKMNKESFHARYMDIYEHIYDCHFFTGNYSLHKDITKEDAIGKIKLLDRKRMYEIVDATPDVVIANEVKRYLFKNKIMMPKTGGVEKLFEAVKNMLEEIKRKYLVEKETNNGKAKSN